MVTLRLYLVLLPFELSSKTFIFSVSKHCFKMAFAPVAAPEYRSASHQAGFKLFL
jgi:hypothetical protein